MEKDEYADFTPYGEIPDHVEGCSYEGKKGNLERITMEGVTEHQPQAGDVAEGCFEVKRSTMKGKGTGAFLFDRGKGRDVRLELELKLEGTVTLCHQRSRRGNENVGDATDHRPDDGHGSHRDEAKAGAKITRLRKDNELGEGGPTKEAHHDPRGDVAGLLRRPTLRKHLTSPHQPDQESVEFDYVFAAVSRVADQMLPARIAHEVK